MENLIPFILGVLSVLVATGVYNMFKTKSLIKDIYEDLEYHNIHIGSIESHVEDLEDRLDRRIDQEIDRVDKQIEDLYKYVDSRTDKMESRTDSKFNENSKFADLIQHAIEKLQYQVSEVQVTLENELNKNNN